MGLGRVPGGAAAQCCRYPGAFASMWEVVLASRRIHVKNRSGRTRKPEPENQKILQGNRKWTLVEKLSYFTIRRLFYTERAVGLPDCPRGQWNTPFPR